ncbi:hypothetical protein F4680DRAFT_452470 [Xylaria scruposa]|nr:hypothetical protein F4680DRAFT_452470 [Xylaria scruposa]
MDVTWDLVKPKKEPKIEEFDSVFIQHPGYQQNNLLFAFPALDSIGPEDNPITGVHFYTILIACGIILGNKFDENALYLSVDRSGQQRVTIGRHDILPHGNYYLQVPGWEEGSEAAHPYSIIPNIMDWRFPHEELPQEWNQPHVAPNNQSSTDPGEHCFVTGFLPTDGCHIIPKAIEAWWEDNGMTMSAARANLSTSDGIDMKCNKLPLLPTYHKIFDNFGFVVVPKPLRVSSSSYPELQTTEPTTDQSSTSLTAAASRSSTSSMAAAGQSSTSSTAAADLAFSIHFLKTENYNPYIRWHNTALHLKNLQSILRDYLFARFAYALFPKLTQFFVKRQTRWVFQLLEDNEYKEIEVSQSDFEKDRKRKGLSRGNKGLNKKRKKGEGSDQVIEEWGLVWDPSMKTFQLHKFIYTESDVYSSESDAGSDSEYDSEGSDRRKRQRTPTPDKEEAPHLSNSISTLGIVSSEPSSERLVPSEGGAHTPEEAPPMCREPSDTGHDSRSGSEGSDRRGQQQSPAPDRKRGLDLLGLTGTLGTVLPKSGNECLTTPQKEPPALEKIPDLSSSTSTLGSVSSKASSERLATSEGGVTTPNKVPELPVTSAHKNKRQMNLQDGTHTKKGHKKKGRSKASTRNAC